MSFRKKHSRGLARRVAARNDFCDRVLFVVDDRRYGAFEKMLDNFPPPSDALRGLMRRKAPWES